MKKNGFTLVELLAVIFVIGLLAVIVYPNITEMVMKSKEDSYNVLIEEIENAASKWALKYASYIPDGETITIRLIDLKKEGLIDKDITNPLTKRKFPDDMIIKIISKDGKLKYEVDVDSGTEEEDIDLNKPSIILIGLPYEKVEINTIYNDKGAVATDSKGNKIDSSKIVKKITKDKVEVFKIDTSDFYEYEIEYSVTDPHNGKKANVKRKVEVKDTIPPVLKIPPHTTISSADLSFSVMERVSATDNSLKKPTITTEGNVTLGIPGDYIIKYTATDGSGNSRTKKRTITVSDDACVKIKIEGTVESGKFTNKDVILTAYLQNGHTPPKEVKYQWQKEVSGNWVDIAGATERSYKITSNKEDSNYRFVSSYGDCKVVSNVFHVVTDKVPPTITPKLFFEIDGTNLYTEKTWTNKTVYTNCTANDNVGIEKIEISKDGKNWITFKYDYTKEPYKIDVEGTNYRYYRAKDKAGNYSEVLKRTITIDKTKPTVTPKLFFAGDGTDLYPENTWTNRTVYTSCKASDNASGISVLEISKDGKSWITYDYDYTKDPYQIPDSGTNYRYYRAKDNAGNYSDVVKKTISIDKIAPTVTPKLFFAGDGTDLYPENTWTNKTVYTSCKASDSNSGISTLEISKDGKSWTTYDYDYTKDPYQIPNSGTNYRYYRAKDKVGNYSDVVKKTIFIDKIAPECVSSGGSDSWTNGSRNLVGTCSDSLSGCKGNVTKSYSTQINTSVSPGTVYDKVGNSTLCPNQTVRIDKTAPTCSISKSGTVGNNGWYKAEAVSLSLSKSDTGGSGVLNYGLSSSSSTSYNGKTTGSQSDTGGVTWYGFVKDAAGNTNSCNSGSFKVDTYAYTPTVTRNDKDGSVTCNQTSGTTTNSITCNGSGKITYSFSNSTYDNLSGWYDDENWLMGYGTDCYDPKIDSNTSWGNWHFNDGHFDIRGLGCTNMTFKVRSHDKAGNISKELVVNWNVYY